MKSFHAILLLAGLTLSAPALAHDDIGAHGGRLVDAGNYHVELVISGSRADVYVADDAGKPVSSRGFKGVALLVAAGKPVRIELEADDVKLTGTSATPLPKNAKGAVRLTTPDGKTAQGQFK